MFNADTLLALLTMVVICLVVGGLMQRANLTRFEEFEDQIDDLIKRVVINVEEPRVSMSEATREHNRRKMTMTNEEWENMINIPMTIDQSRMVNAILNTHAEMQDMSATQSMELRARIKSDAPEDREADDHEMVEHLEGQIVDLEADSEALRQLARIFPTGV